MAACLPLSGVTSLAWGYTDDGSTGPAPRTPAAKADGPPPVRLALLIGNRAYPPPFDLPPVHKNVREIGRAHV